MKWLPNALTILRCILAFVVGWAILKIDIGPTDQLLMVWSTISLTLFATVAITDYLDGYLARKLDATSEFGARLDPIADKLLVAVSLLALSEVSGWAWFLVVPTVIIIVRDLGVTLLREAFKNVQTLSVTKLSKWKTAAEMVGIGTCLFALASVSSIAVALGTTDVLPLVFVLTPVSMVSFGLGLTAIGLIWIAAALSLYTGFQYARAAFSKPAL